MMSPHVRNPKSKLFPWSRLVDVYNEVGSGEWNNPAHTLGTLKSLDVPLLIYSSLTPSNFPFPIFLNTLSKNQFESVDVYNEVGSGEWNNPAHTLGTLNRNCFHGALIIFLLK